LGIPFAYFEATNWNIGDKDGYKQTKEHGRIFHTKKDTLEFLNEQFPGRIEERLSTFVQVLTYVLVSIEE